MLLIEFSETIEEVEGGKIFRTFLVGININSYGRSLTKYVPKSSDLKIFLNL